MQRTEQPPGIPHTDPPQQGNTLLKDSSHSEMQSTSLSFCGTCPQFKPRQLLPTGYVAVCGGLALPGYQVTPQLSWREENTTENSRIELRTGEISHQLPPQAKQT